MKPSRFALKAGLGAGLFSVLCCAGPVIAVLFGFGGASALFGLDRFRVYFLIVGGLILLGASFLAIRKRRRCCVRRNWVGDVLVIFLIFGSGFTSYAFLQYGAIPVLSKIAGNKIKKNSPLIDVKDAKLAVLKLKVEGMTCSGCTLGVQKAFTEVPGVREVVVDWPSGTSVIHYDPNRTNPEEIMNAKVQDTYRLSMIPP